MSSTSLRRTALYDSHVALNARLVDFSGWDMPIQYTGILDEARAVRSGAGMFDVSHMGRVTLEGENAAKLLGSVLSVDVSGMRIGRARYNVICDESGGIIDDCIVYRKSDEGYFLIPNASNTGAVLEWLEKWRPSSGVQIENVTSDTAMIAVQGPNAVSIVDALADTDLSALRPFASVDTMVSGRSCMVARTGYTGEDGVELVVNSASDASAIWSALVDAGVVPCGLGSRDVLRLEAALLLHGNDMDTSVNPYEAGLDRFVDPDREGYAARDALLKIKNDGTSRKLVGFSIVGRGIPRHGYAIYDGETGIGEVSSGGHSPTLDMSIGMGYVLSGYAGLGTRFDIDIRGRRVEAQVTKLPFYSRRKNA